LLRGCNRSAGLRPDVLNGKFDLAGNSLVIHRELREKSTSRGGVMQLQLKHLPILFLALAALCLTGALTASAEPAAPAPISR
jgi:hypothetical protein